MASKTMVFRHTFQSGATATGNGTAMDVAGLPLVGVQITGITTATVTFEVTIDGSTWVATRVLNVTGGAVGSTTTASGIFLVPTAGMEQLRCRISSYTAGTITAKGVGMLVNGAFLAV